MRYKVKGRLIRSENAAKSHLQKSSILIKLLDKEKKVDMALDYGCGKLRYLENLQTISKKLYVYDSDVQLKRTQKILGKSTSVVNFLKGKRNCKVLDGKTISKYRSRFDFILLSNVLSAIPSISARKECLKNIRNLLSLNGRCLITLQYKSSCFDDYKLKVDSVRHLDGHIYSTRNGSHYYGIITPQKLFRLLKSSNLKIISSIVKAGSVYVVISR